MHFSTGRSFGDKRKDEFCVSRPKLTAELDFEEISRCSAFCMNFLLAAWYEWRNNKALEFVTKKDEFFNCDDFFREFKQSETWTKIDNVYNHLIQELCRVFLSFHYLRAQSKHFHKNICFISDLVLSQVCNVISFTVHSWAQINWRKFWR